MLDMQRCMLEADGPPSAKKVIANVEQVLMVSGPLEDERGSGGADSPSPIYDP